MLRRMFVLFYALPFVAAASKAEPVPKRETLDEMWNDFTRQVTAWIPVAQEYTNSPGESPIHVQREWEHVRKSFHDVDVFVRNL